MIGLLPLRKALSKRSCGLNVESATVVGFDMFVMMKSENASD